MVHKVNEILDLQKAASSDAANGLEFPVSILFEILQAYADMQKTTKAEEILNEIIRIYHQKHVSTTKTNDIEDAEKELCRRFVARSTVKLFYAYRTISDDQAT